VVNLHSGNTRSFSYNKRTAERAMMPSSRCGSSWNTGTNTSARKQRTSGNGNSDLRHQGPGSGIRGSTNWRGLSDLRRIRDRHTLSQRDPWALIPLAVYSNSDRRINVILGPLCGVCRTLEREHFRTINVQWIGQWSLFSRCGISWNQYLRAVNTANSPTPAASTIHIILSICYKRRLNIYVHHFRVRAVCPTASF
jgi:hypothetical protein